ncbi:hypothetical protein CFC21_005427, partial [Triticum aestivum]
PRYVRENEACTANGLRSLVGVEKKL